MHFPSRRATRTLALCALLSALLSAGAGASAQDTPALPLYDGQPIAGSRIVFGDFDVQQALAGAQARMPADPRQTHAVVEARHEGGALGLRWKDTWYATLRIEAQPLDLRPYLPEGVLSFDLKVNELARGGLAFRVDCGAGENCERKVVDVVAARVAQGQGWQHRVYSLACFARAGDDYSGITRAFALDAIGAGDVELRDLSIEAHGQPNTSCPDYRTVSVTPAPLEESWSLGKWMPRHEAKLAEIARRNSAGEPTDIIFVGDSITQNWEDGPGKAVWAQRYGGWHALDLGFSGDRTENLLWRLQHGEVDGIDPRVAVLLIGTNNTGARQEDPATTLAGIRKDLGELRQRLPHTRILLLAIFPRGAGPDDAARRLNEQVNAMLPGLADGRQVVFLNINQAFLAPDGTLSRDIMPDLLHPNARGHAIWAEAMAPTLEQLMR